MIRSEGPTGSCLLCAPHSRYSFPGSLDMHIQPSVEHGPDPTPGFRWVVARPVVWPASCGPPTSRGSLTIHAHCAHDLHMLALGTIGSVVMARDGASALAVLLSRDNSAVFGLTCKEALWGGIPLLPRSGVGPKQHASAKLGCVVAVLRFVASSAWQ
jgi:hypothetical protein